MQTKLLISPQQITTQEGPSGGLAVPVVSVLSALSPQRAVLTSFVGTPISTYRGHTHFVETLAWSPDGSRIASGGWDEKVHVWDHTKAEPILIYDGHASNKAVSGGMPEGMIFAVAWSPDGTSIASGSWDKTVQVWEASNGRQNLDLSQPSYQRASIGMVP